MPRTATVTRPPLPESRRNQILSGSAPGATASFTPIPPEIQSKTPQESRGVTNEAPKCDWGNKVGSFDPASPPLPTQDQRKPPPPPRSTSTAGGNQLSAAASHQDASHLSPCSGSNPGGNNQTKKPTTARCNPRRQQLGVKNWGMDVPGRGQGKAATKSGCRRWPGEGDGVEILGGEEIGRAHV